MFHAKEYVKAESLEQAYALNQKKSNVLVGGMIKQPGKLPLKCQKILMGSRYRKARTTEK